MNRIKKNKIYVSYAWKVEDQNNIVDRLEETCLLHDITLLRDKKELDYKDSIRKYMGELAAGDAIILVLSEAYFKSAYCMYELCEAHKREDFHKSIFPIIVSGTLFHKTKERVSYIRFWENETTELKDELKTVDMENLGSSSHAELKEYGEYCRVIDDLLAVLADMNTLTEDIHINTNFEQLLDKLQALNIQEPQDSKSKPESRKTKEVESAGQRNQDKFEAKIRKEICKALEKKPLEALQAVFYKKLNKTKKNEDVFSEIMDTWWQAISHLEKVEQFHKITEDCLENLAEDNKTIKQMQPVCSQARKIMGWLVLATVSQEWLKQHYRPDNPFQHISLEFESSIEIVTASLAYVPASFTSSEKGLEVTSDRMIRVEKKSLANEQTRSLAIAETGWLTGPTVEEVGKVIWKLLSNESKKAALTTGEWNKLATICRGQNKYLAIDCSNESGHPFQNDEICQSLYEKLRNINIVRFGVIETEDAKSPLLVEEGELTGNIYLFLELIEKHEKML